VQVFGDRDAAAPRVGVASRELRWFLMLVLTNLGKSFGARTLFSGVTEKLTPESRYGLVGANGSGKTTLLRIMSGDETPTRCAGTSSTTR
jgi:ATPase subunit of ABC transporter with duplicated ATPase domains